MLEIDGSYLEGGGQILRTACALSAVTKKPCRVFNIRKLRPKPGLMPQHLLGIQALAQLCHGRLEGDFLGSEEIKFWPGEIYRSSASINIPTAGSITLVLQTLIPPALLAPGPIKITFAGGATDTFFSPTIDHFRYVFLKILEKITRSENGSRPLSLAKQGEAGFAEIRSSHALRSARADETKFQRPIEVNLLRRGYYPEGGAKAEVKVFPARLKNLNLTERGPLKKILAISGAANSLQKQKAAERQLAGVREVLGKLKLPIEERIEYYETRCPGSQICLIAEFENTIIGTDNLGKLGKRVEDVGKEAALELLKEQKTGACLDKHLSDQLLLYLALSPGKSQVTVSEITRHLQTNAWVVQHFLSGELKIEGNAVSWIPKKS